MKNKYIRQNHGNGYRSLNNQKVFENQGSGAIIKTQVFLIRFLFDHKQDP